MEYYLEYNETRSGGEKINPEEDWSDRTDEVITWQPAIIARSRDSHKSWRNETIQSDVDIAPGTAVYLIVVRYSDGDTFGRTRGLWKIIGIYQDAAKALEIKTLINGHYDDTEKMKPLCGKWGVPWDGYFASFEYVELHTMLMGP